MLGTGAYLDDLDAKLKPIELAARSRDSRHRGDLRRHRLADRPQHQPAARPTRRPHAGAGRRRAGRGHSRYRAAATRSARWPQPFRSSRTTPLRIRGLEKTEAETQQRAAAERRAAMENIASDFERSVNGIVRSVATAAAGMQTTAQSMTATASDASARAATVGAASDSASNNVGTVAAAAEELSSSVAEISRQVTQSSEIASKAVGRCRAHQRHRPGAVDRRREDRRSGQADPQHRRADQPAGAECHHRGGARRRIRPRLRRRCLRSEGARQPDRQGHRGNLHPGRGDAVVHQRGGGCRSAASPKPSRR